MRGCANSRKDQPQDRQTADDQSHVRKSTDLRHLNRKRADWLADGPRKASERRPGVGRQAVRVRQHEPFGEFALSLICRQPFKASGLKLPDVRGVLKMRRDPLGSRVQIVLHVPIDLKLNQTRAPP